MKLTHKVFFELPHGGRLWMASASSLKDASDYLRSFAATSPGTYLIVELRSRGLVKPVEEGTAGTTAWSRLSAPIRLPRAWLEPLKARGALWIRGAALPPKESA